MGVRRDANAAREKRLANPGALGPNELTVRDPGGNGVDAAARAASSSAPAAALLTVRHAAKRRLTVALRAWVKVGAIEAPSAVVSKV